MGYTARGQTAVNVDSPNIGFHNLTFLRGGGSWKSPCIMSYQTCQTCYIMSYPTKALAMTLKREDEIGPQVNLIRRRFGSSKAIPLKTKAPYLPLYKEGTNRYRQKKTFMRGVQYTFSTTWFFPDVLHKFLRLEFPQKLSWASSGVRTTILMCSCLISHQLRGEQ